ncbi:MAG: hypothetical protein C0615_00035 [Desulfuromonas sp.]|nr:MAG: hypothetical protein C0615_00035 [Desulfuromonas sp.]
MNRIIRIHFVAGLLLLFLPGAMNDEWKNVHKETKECREHSKVECQFSCKFCHGEPWQPISHEKLKGGDYSMCTQCHKTKLAELASANLSDCMPRHHQKNIAYAPSGINPRFKLKKRPDNLVLFCDPPESDNCRVFCISCHKPMEEPGKRMRVEKNFKLCKECHDI